MKKTSFSSLPWYHRLWQQYWYAIVFVVIVVIALALRFYRLADVPHGMTWDEAAIGYNGWAIWKARRDEWLVRLPISFKSFGDYKAPFAIYLTAIVSGILGLSLWTLRLPFALAGGLAVVGLGVWVKLWLQKFLPLRSAQLLSLLAAGLLTISPWHLHFSRAGFESGLALTWIIWGMVFFSATLSWANTKLHKSGRILGQSLLMILSGACFVASIYTYHSAKVFVPLLALLLLATNYRRLWQQKISVLLGGLVAVVASYPLLKDTFAGQGGTRFTQSSIFGQGLSPLELLQTFFQHLVTHFAPNFLVFGQTTTLRHGDGHWGVLYFTSLLVIVAGFILVATRKKIRQQFGQLVIFGVAWVIAGIIPAAIGIDVPHSNRALLALPGFIVLTIISIRMMCEWLETLSWNKKVQGSHGEDHLLRKSFVGTFLLLEIVCFAAYTRHYYTDFATQSASDWQDGYLAAMKLAASREAMVDKILFTDAYQQPYIYALFVRKTNPIWYQGGSLIKFEFSHTISEGDLSRPKTLIIATPQEVSPKLGQELIYGSDGSVRFVVVQTE